MSYTRKEDCILRKDVLLPRPTEMEHYSPGLLLEIIYLSWARVKALKLRVAVHRTSQSKDLELGPPSQSVTRARLVTLSKVATLQQIKLFLKA